MTARLLKQDSAGLARIITNTEWWGPRSVGGGPLPTWTWGRGSEGSQIDSRIFDGLPWFDPRRSAHRGPKQRPRENSFLPSVPRTAPPPHVFR